MPAIRNEIDCILYSMFSPSRTKSIVIRRISFALRCHWMSTDEKRYRHNDQNTVDVQEYLHIDSTDGSLFFLCCWKIYFLQSFSCGQDIAVCVRITGFALQLVCAWKFGPDFAIAPLRNWRCLAARKETHILQSHSELAGCRRFYGL